MSITVDAIYKNLDLALYAFLSGLLPSLLWLWFWLREDLHPEPKKMLLKTFFAGAAVIPAVFLIEYGFFKLFLNLNLTTASNYSLGLIFALAATEEYFKYFAAKQAALNNKKIFDEPIDALIYLITAAMGFAALENTIYIFQGFVEKGMLPAILSGNFRFLGATLIHAISSAAIGVGIAFSFFHKENAQRNLAVGFLTAVLLHSFFNYFIINSGDNIFKVFLGVWILAIILIYLFEKIKNPKT